MSFRSRRTVSRSKNSSDRKLRIEPLENRTLLAADFSLIGEFASDVQNRSSKPSPIGEFNGSLLFGAATGHFWDLWRSDGTDAGTTQLADLYIPGFTRGVASHVNMDGTLYFLVGEHDINPQDDEVGDAWELWKSDGTAVGTERVFRSEIYDLVRLRFDDLRQMTVADGQVYFIAEKILLSSDGTSAGTIPISEWPGNVTEFKNVGGKLFFTGDETYWTAPGTRVDPGLWIYDIATQERTSLSNSGANNGVYPQNLTPVGDAIFFTARTADAGRELWRSDGTEAGTFLVKDIKSGVSDSAIRSMTNIDGTLFFVADDGAGGNELWTSDGTEAGTFRVKDIRDGAIGSYLSDLVGVDGVAYFIANDGVAGNELWRSDGTETGTLRVADLYAGEAGANPAFLTNVDGVLYFAANDGIAGLELWRSDGTETGTYSVRDILPGAGESAPVGLMNVGGRLFFAAAGRLGDHELWVSDGTSEGTRQVKDLYDRDLLWQRKHLFEFNGKLFFSARTNPSSSIAVELWKSDGVAESTTLVKKLNHGWYRSNPAELTVLNEALYFIVFTGSYGSFGTPNYELWRTDGTAAGLIAVQSNLPTLSHLTRIDDALYFVGGDAGSPGELWKSDGTTAGTVQLKDIRSGATSSNPRFLTNVAGRLFFTANDGSTGEELWVSDGTEAGTRLVKDIVPGSNSTSLENLVEMGGAVYFTANEGASGVELWKSDGTAAGTFRVKDIALGAGSSTPAQLINVGGTLYFTANDPMAGEELWRSDGTEAGTVRVRDIRPGSVSSTPAQLIDVSGTLYFVANDGVAGIELWTSDGTENGTRLVSDLRPGAADSKPVNLTNIDGQLYFHANDGSQGVELWSSDGSAAGTKLIADFDAAAGIGLSSLDGRLVVVTLNDEFHEQLWIEETPLTALPGDYDASGGVDGADFLAWQRGFGGVATPAGSGADGDGSGTVDAGDLGVWAEHFGEGSLGGGAAASTAAMSVETVEAEGYAAEVAAAGSLVAKPRAANGADLIALAQAAVSERDGRGEIGAARGLVRADEAEETPSPRRAAAAHRDAAFAALAGGPREMRRDGAAESMVRVGDLAILPELRRSRQRGVGGGLVAASARVGER